MGTLDPQDDHYTLVNIFTAAEGKEEALYDEIVGVTELVRTFPGFVSANLHRGESDDRLVNYVQWRSEADFTAMTSDPAVQEHFRRCRAIATCESVFCRLEYTQGGRAR